MTDTVLRPFRDRGAAGCALAKLVTAAEIDSLVVGALSGGSVLVGAAAARCLSAPLGIVQVAELRLPYDMTPFGAVDEDGEVVVDYVTMASYRVSQSEVDSARDYACPSLRAAREALGFGLAAKLPAPAVILVSEGLVSGLPMQAAVNFCRRRGVKKIAVAAPWSAPAAAAWFRSDVQWFFTLAEDDRPIAEHYDAAVVEDAAIRTALAEAGG